MKTEKSIEIIASCKRRIANLEKAVNREYRKLANHYIPKAQKTLGRKLATSGELSDWIEKNAQELKPLNPCKESAHWGYWPANYLIYGEYETEE